MKYSIAASTMGSISNHKAKGIETCGKISCLTVFILLGLFCWQ